MDKLLIVALVFGGVVTQAFGEAAARVRQEIKLLPAADAENRTEAGRDSTSSAAQVNAEAVKSVRLVLPKQSDAILKNIGRVFSRQIQSRCDAKVVEEGDAPLTVELAVEPGIGDEGFKIADGSKGTVRIIGNDARGVLYGIGKFLHTSTYGKEGFAPGTWRGVSVPKMPVRGIYFATHFQNYYQVAPIEEVTRYVEELSLWGPNSFQIWFGMEEFNGMDDPKAKAMIERLRALLKIVKERPGRQLGRGMQRGVRE